MSPELPKKDAKNRTSSKKIWMNRGLLAALAVLTAFGSVQIFGITRALFSGDIVSIGIFSPSGAETVLDGDALAPTLIPAPVVELETWDGSSRVTILLLGLDFRDWVVGNDAPLSDTMMLLTLDPNSGTGGILSIPRDLWVSIPGFGHAKINTAYKLGESAQLPGRGPGLAVATVEQFLGIQINYFAQIDFAAFVHFIDTIGCVKLDVPEPLKIDVLDTPWPITLDAGTQTLCGDHALAYARARNTAGGDFDRALRQQQVILAMRDQLLHRDVQAFLIGNAFAIYTDIISGIQTNMSFEEGFQLGLLGLGINLDNLTIDTIGIEHVLIDVSPDGLDILKPIPSKIRILRDRIFSPEASISPALLDLTSAELMQAEGVTVAIYNGTLTNGMAGATRDFLVSLGVNIIIADTASELQNFTNIIDYTGNPYTLKFLIEVLGIQKNRIFFEYNPDSNVDVEIILGNDWSIP